MTHVLRIKAYFKDTLLPAMFYISSLSNYLTLSLDTFWKALYIIIKRHDFERKKKERKKKRNMIKIIAQVSHVLSLSI